MGPYHYGEFKACSKCYTNCAQQDTLQCSVCGKCSHYECLKITKRRYDELSQFETNMFVCSNKCAFSTLSFSNIPHKVFLNTTVGKRKMPCKSCYGECKNFNNRIQCLCCLKWQHLECVFPNTSDAKLFFLKQKKKVKRVFFKNSDSFFCSKVCEMRFFPFHSLSDLELYAETTFPSIFLTNPNDSNCSPASNSVPIPIETIQKHVEEQLESCIDPFTQVFCGYVGQNDVPDVLNTGDPSNFSIFHSNVISLKKNLNLVEEVFEGGTNHPSVIAISETGLLEDEESKVVSIKGYNFERNDSLTSKGSVGLYMMDHIGYEFRKDLNLNTNFCEDLWLELTLNNLEKQNDDSLVVGVIYRHPDHSYRSFKYKLCQTILKLNKEKKKFMIVGDMNIDLLKFNLVGNVTDFVNELQSSGCNTHCNLPTRIKDNSISCLDHVYSNFEQHKIETSVILSDISDHFSTLTKITSVRHQKMKNIKAYKRKFRINELEEQQLLTDLNILLNNDPVIAMDACPNIKAKIIIQSYQNIIDKYYPLKRISKKALKFINKPWLTKGIKISIIKKNKLYYKLKNKFSVEADAYFRKYRNILTKIKNKAYNSYYREKAAAAKNNISKTWTIINEITKRKKSKGTKIDCMIDQEGRKVTNRQRICNMLNDHFSTIGKNGLKV